MRTFGLFLIHYHAASFAFAGCVLCDRWTVRLPAKFNMKAASPHRSAKPVSQIRANFDAAVEPRENVPAPWA